MNLMNKLLAAENTQVEKATKEWPSKRLGRLTGQPFEMITLKEISGRKFGAVKDRAEGGGDALYESNLLCCVYGIADPDLRDPKLLEKFGVHTPKDLVEKLFSGEAYAIAGEIVELSGLLADDQKLEEEIKN